MIRKMLCFIGWHEWTWKLSDVECIDDKIPDFAICKHCGERYDKK